MRNNIIDINMDMVAMLVYGFKEGRTTVPSYIVMNSDTLNAIESSVRDMTTCSNYTTLFGLPITVSETLKFGEIEVI